MDGEGASDLATQVSIDIDGFIQISGRTLRERRSDTYQLDGLDAIEQIVFSSHSDGRSQALRLISAAEAPDAATDFPAVKSSQLLWKPGMLQKGADGNYSVAQGKDVQLVALLHLPTPLSPEARGYWLVLTVAKRNGWWGFDFSDLTTFKAQCHTADGNKWRSQLLGNLIGLGPGGFFPLYKVIGEWQLHGTNAWGRQRADLEHPFLNKRSALLLQSQRDPRFGVRLEAQASAGLVTFEGVSHYLKATGLETGQNQDQHEFRELNLAALTGQAVNANQPFNLLLLGGADMLCVADQTAADLRRDSFILEWQGIPGDHPIHGHVCVRNLWALITRHYPLGLAAVKARNRLTLFPAEILFEADDNNSVPGGMWCLRFRVVRQRDTRAPAWSIRLVEIAPAAPATPFVASLVLPGATDATGAPLTRRVRFDPRPDYTVVDAGKDGTGIRPLLELTAGAQHATPASRIVVGGAALTLAEVAALRLTIYTLSPLFSYPQAPLEAQLELTFEGAMVRPASQDPEIGFETLAAWQGRDRPISIDLAPADTQVLYHCFEAAASDQSRVLRIGVAAKGRGVQNPVDVVVIDPAPLLVGRIVVRDGRENDAGELLAEYTEDAELPAEWSFANPTGEVAMVLPSQAIGEEVIKGLYNYPGTQKQRPDPGMLFDFRLSPAARLSLDLSDIDVARTTAPWATRRLFSQRLGVVGVKTDSAAFELLYGLTARIKAPGLRIAETDAFVGRVPFSDDLLKLFRDFRLKPGAIADQDAVRIYQRRYASEVAGWIGRLFCRPAQLTVFRDFADRSLLTLSDGVSFEKRRSRQSANPFAIDKLASSNQAPVDGREPLRGGLDYGFESPMIAQEFWDDQTAGIGTVSGLRFSALGGSGAQQAAFNQGKTLIITDTTDGRLNSLTLIRVGRIGMLWNRARHVIVYERTARTAPRYQSRGTGTGKDDRKEVQPSGFEGLAALRKVKEYVEITQPRRQYPDTTTRDPINGPLDAATFETLAIPVKASWGMDVDQGWKVALRGPLAPDEERFYPFPKIFVELGRSEQKGGGHVSQQAADPSQLFFFTSTNPADGGDTDAWPAWPGIDYPPLGRPLAPDLPAAPRLGNSKQPDAARHDLGQRRFTIDLMPSEEAANLMHGRPFAGIDARLSNISLARGMPDLAALVSKAVSDGTRDFGRLQGAVAEGMTELRGRLTQLAATANETLSPGLRQEAADLVAALLERAAKSTTQLGKITTGANTWLDRQKIFTDHAAEGDKFYLGMGNPGGIWRQQLEGAIKAVAAVEPAHVDQARSRIIDTLTQVGIQVEERLAAVPSVVSLALDSVNRLIAEAESRAQAWASSSATGLVSLVDQWAARQDGSDGQLAAARRELAAALEATQASVDSLACAAVQWMTAGLAEWFAPNPGNPVPGLAEFREGFSDLLLEVEVWIAECLLATEEDNPDFDEWREMVGGFTVPGALFAGAYDWVMQRESDTLSELQELWAPAIAKFRAQIASVASQIGTIPDLAGLQAAGPLLLTVLDNATDGGAGYLLQHLRDDIDAQVGSIKSLGAPWDEVATAVQGIQQHGERVEHELEELLNRINNSAGAVASELLHDLDQRLEPLHHSLQAVGGELESTAAAQLGQWRDAAERLEQNGLEFTRALATGPLTDTLRATRDQLGYYYDAARQALDVTKSSAIFNTMGGEVLNALSAAMPFDGLRDRLLPQLAQFDVSKLLPDFGGLKLEYLLRNLKIPDDPLEEYNWIKMAHGFDRDQLSAWADITIDKLFEEGDAELFSLPPLALRLKQPRFQAYSRMIVGRDGAKTQTTRATLSADWLIELSGKPVLTIQKGILHYDSAGGFNFDMDINALALDESLRFLSDAMQLMKPDDSGVLVTPILPGGVSATLDLPLPDIGTGAFTLTGITLSMHFDLLFAPRFEVRTGLWLSKPDRPFGLAILFLGGGGWFGVDLSYQPPSKFTTRVSIGLSAGAFAALNFGVAAGSAGLLFTAGLDFYSASGDAGGSSTAISVGILMWGEFSICGVASAYLRVVMRVTQQGGGKMVGYGNIEVRIRICWCFTLRVNSPISMPFMGQAQQRAVAMLAGAAAEVAAIAVLAAAPTVQQALDAHFANLDI